MAIIPEHGYKRRHRRSRACDARAWYERHRADYGEQLRPKCPRLGQWLTEVWHFRFPPMPSLKPPAGPMAWRILMVADELAALRLDEGMVQVWANAPGLLDAYLEPIRADLKALPIALKVHGDGRLEAEAKQCRQAIDELEDAATDYRLNRGHPTLVYLMPPKALLWEQMRDNPVAQHFQLGLFTQWREGEILRRKMAGLEQEARCFERMSNTFPVAVVTAAGKLAAALKPIVDAFSEEAERTQPRGPAAAQPGQRNISGMDWQKAQILAEELVAKEGFPGRTELKKRVRCHHRTLAKAIEHSLPLQAAEEAYEEARAAKPKTVTLSNKYLSKTESKTVDPSEEATVNEILSSLSRDQMIARMTEWTRILNGPGDHETVSTEELTAQLGGHDDKEVAQIYVQLEAQVDEIKADAAKKRNRRKETPPAA